MVLGNKRGLGWLSLAGLVLGLVLACSSDEESGGSSDNACGTDVDCPGSQVCDNGECVDSSNGGSSGSGASGGTGGSSAGTSNTGGMGGSTEVRCTSDDDCGPEQVCAAERCLDRGQCANPADTEAVNATYERVNTAGETVEEMARDIGRQCGIDCLYAAMEGDDNEDLRQCTHACIQERVPTSDTCTWCLVFSVECGRENCLNECIIPENEACFPCVCGENNFGIDCIAKYEACAGVPSTTCDGL